MRGGARRATRALVGGAVAAMLVVAGGCSIRTDSAPRDITDERQRELQVAEPEPGGAPATGDERIFVVTEADRLRTVARQPDGANAEALLRVLFDGENDDERELGLRTAIPDGTTLHDVTVQRDVVTIDIGDELSDLPSRELVLAVGQIVYTADEAVPDTARVVISVNGERHAWPDVSRRQLTRPLTIYDFTGLPESAQPEYPSNFHHISPTTVPPSTTTSTTTTTPTTTAGPTTIAPTTARRPAPDQPTTQPTPPSTPPPPSSTTPG